MIRKRILIVAMLDSVHTFRWLSQFKDSEIDFIIFPSKKHKAIHEGTLKLINSKNRATFNLARFRKWARFHGYLDFLTLIVISRILKRDFRLQALLKLAHKNQFTYVHALEIQGAGYLVDSLKRAGGFGFSTILTNWGSDIYYYQNLPDHKERITSALISADFYSAECRRDYSLARSLGFLGIELPCIPNAGGFLEEDQTLSATASSRVNVVAKAYGGEFGRGDLIISALRNAFAAIPGYTAFLYSVTDDLIEQVEGLVQEFPGRVAYSSRKNPLTRAEMKGLFRRSRVYVGASRSDGISTSFLEALNYGCYPIQTNTSCAGDWKELGADASIVSQDISEIENNLIMALKNDELVDKAQIKNLTVAKEFLGFEKISKIAKTFYS
jgi:glycosyltransferase involved in cell wall biosynthesis